MDQFTVPLKAIIGLGNPGSKYARTRHNIGFRIVDALADAHGGSWQSKGQMEVASITIGNISLLLIKPQTFMNSSGAIVPLLAKQGIKVENVLVVHDELELPFGELKFKKGGSAKGHNGLKSLIEAWGPEFLRLRFGIGRPADREQVPDYVLQNFSENEELIQEKIMQAVQMIENETEKTPA